jgi:RNA polymerase sigma-70 factor (ECF subfamily)
MSGFVSKLSLSARVRSPETPFERCYQADYAGLRRYAHRLSGGLVDPDDLVQEAFARLWSQFEQGKPVANPRPWLYRVITNLTINASKIRRRETDTEQAPERSGPVDLERNAMHRQLVRRALSSLPAPMRNAVLLSHAGLTGAEIAEVLGIKPSYVGTLVLRAHERFRRECDSAERR